MRYGGYWLLLSLYLLTACSSKPFVDPSHSMTLPLDASLPLTVRLHQKGLRFGDPVFIRIFKEELILELWMQRKPNSAYTLFRTYPICDYSGALGPKRKEGDRQAPEGFYTVDFSNLKPDSRYYRAFNLGYPNVYDKTQGYTGSYLMVHGGCVSVGCYAMGDEAMKEIYQLVEAALLDGQPYFQVHAMPFRMTAERLSREKMNRWYPFWRQLERGYDRFEQSKIPPETQVVQGKYVLSERK